MNNLGNAVNNAVLAALIFFLIVCGVALLRDRYRQKRRLKKPLPSPAYDDRDSIGRFRRHVDTAHLREIP